VAASKGSMPLFAAHSAIDLGMARGVEKEGIKRNV